VKVFFCRLATVSLAVFFTLGTLFSKDTQEITSVIAFDRVAQVSRGGEVQIELSAIPNYGNQIIFEVQQKPLHGTLSSLQYQNDHTALVNYHNDGKKGVLKDAFTYRVGSVGRAKSIAYKVKIQVVPPPSLVIFEPKFLDFGEVYLSVSKEIPVTVSNQGGESVIFRLVLPKEFSSSDKENISLDEGESKKLLISFSPVVEGLFVGQASILPAIQKEVLQLRGKALARYEVAKKEGMTWSIKNLFTNTLKVNFSGGEGWSLPPETLIQPLTQTTVTFTQVEQSETETNPLPKNTQVVISDGLSTNVIELPQPQPFIPLFTQRLSSESLGAVVMGNAVQVKFQIQNRSSCLKHLQWSFSSAAGGGISEANKVDVHGGEAKEISFAWMPRIPGAATLVVSVLDGLHSKSEIRWNASVFAAASAGDLIKSSDLSPNEVTEGQSHPVAIPTPPPLTFPQIEGLTSGVDSSWYGADELFIQWETTENDPAQISLEELCLLKPNSPMGSMGTNQQLPQLTFQLIPIKIAYHKVSRGMEKIVVTDLKPGFHLLRLSLINNGHITHFSQFEVRMPSHEDWWNRWKVKIWTIALMFLLFVLWRVKHLGM
jgi:hypothetical protein